MTLCIHMPAMGPSSVRNMLAAFFSISVFSAVFTGNLSLVSAAVRQAPSSEPYYLAPNGVTVMCPGVAVGDTFGINGVTYTRVDSTTLKSLARKKSSWPQLTTSCTTGITSMSELFETRKKFNVDISSWDTSSVTDMGNMFYYAQAFNQPIGDWDVSSVTDMTSMFFKAHAFNQPIGDWNVRSVTNMYQMFRRAYAFNQPIGDWDMSSVETMQNMFFVAKAFNQPIGGWNVGSVTNMKNMFNKAGKFNQDLTGWQVGQITKKSQCARFCKRSDLIKNNQPSLPKKCLKGCHHE